MRIHAASWSVLACLSLTSCASMTEGNSASSSTAAVMGIDCPFCFTMIECMRNGVGVEAETQTIRCERCCDELIFSIGADRQLLVATKRASEPIPAQACMPTPPR
jgi:hypothetical protein